LSLERTFEGTAVLLKGERLGHRTAGSLDRHLPASGNLCGFVGGYEDYSRAKDEMFAHTDTKESPWYVVNADSKKRARLNCIAHLLQQVPYHDMAPVEVELPPRQSTDYKRPKMSSQRFVPEIY
jgi:hypothetical protein